MTRRLSVAFAFAFVFAIPAHAGHVTRIIDGDTLTVLQNKKLVTVRLANIDAPERRQRFGRHSRHLLVKLCLRKDATLAVQGLDRYRRTVATVTCGGVDANRAQVTRGMAWVYTKYNTDSILPALEQSARQSRRGLWVDREPVPPWVWRRLSKDRSEQRFAE